MPEVDRVRLFQYMILFPAIALLGLVSAIAGFSRLSARRHWLHLPQSQWRVVKIQLVLFMLCYPAFWLLSSRLWSVQEYAIPVFTVGAGILGVFLGKRWLTMAGKQGF